MYGGVYGASIGGGGAPGNTVEFTFGALTCTNVACQNSVTDHFATIGGGAGNLVGDTDTNVGNAIFGTIAGGFSNAAVGLAPVGGGAYNHAFGNGSTVGGGEFNTASSGVAPSGEGIPTSQAEVAARSPAVAQIAPQESRLRFRVVAKTRPADMPRLPQANAPRLPVPAPSCGRTAVSPIWRSITPTFAARATGGVGFTVAITASGAST